MSVLYQQHISAEKITFAVGCFLFNFSPAGAASMTVAIWNYMNSSWIGFDDVRVTAVSMKKYYYAGGQRVAMRNGNTIGTSGLYWLLADHLGSTNKVVNANGTLHSWQLYKAWGEWRAGSTPGLLTDYTFTGQKVVSGVGLYYYGARWYDTLTHFVQPDSIIPDPYNPLDWNRYAYARYNPLVYTDPTGHWPEWLDRALEFAQGVAYQFANDMTGGAVDSLASSAGVLCMDCNASDAYKQGQQVGRTASTVVASAEFVLGAAATGAALAAIPTTTGGGMVCTALLGGVCALPTGAVVAIEAVIAAGGVVVAGHGTVTAAYIKSNPLTSGDATSTAKKLGYTRKIPPQKAPFNSHGQTVYYNSKTKTYITIDIDQHRGPGWKMFDSKGNRIGTYDLSLENLIGK